MLRPDSLEHGYRRRSNDPSCLREIDARFGPWRTVEQVELATLEWVDWWNQRRLHSAFAGLSPAEYENIYHHDQQELALVGATQDRLHQTQGDSVGLCVCVRIDLECVRRAVG